MNNPIQWEEFYRKSLEKPDHSNFQLLVKLIQKDVLEEIEKDMRCFESHSSHYCSVYNHCAKHIGGKARAIDII